MHTLFPLQHGIRLVHILPDSLQVARSDGEDPGLLGGIGLREFGIEMPDVISLLGHVTRAVDGEVFGTVKVGRRLGIRALLAVSVIRGLGDKAWAVVAFVLVADKHGRDSQERAPVHQFDVIRRAEAGTVAKTL